MIIYVILLTCNSAFAAISFFPNKPIIIINKPIIIIVLEAALRIEQNTHGNIIYLFSKIYLFVKYNCKIKFSIMMNKNSKKSRKVIVLTGLKICIKHVQKRNVISKYLYQRLFDNFDQSF